MVNLDKIEAARNRLADVIHQTPVESSRTYSQLAENDVYLKLENLQKTGSFKVRGAYNKIASLTEDEKGHGVIAASAGNHAQGVSLAATLAGIKSTIVMPEGAPLAKVQATKQYGSEVILHGDTFDEALEFALQQQRQTGAAFIHAFDDEAVIAGQGTIGLEILEQVPDADAVICPIGGGGLIAGVAAAVKSVNPAITVYGVQTEAYPGMVASLHEKKPVAASAFPTIADGIAVKHPGKLTYEITEQYVDDIVTVDELEIARTMLSLLERSKIIAEGSGAVSLAALIYQKLPIKHRKVVPIISGGNVDINFIPRIIEFGLAEAGRFVTLSTLVTDKPGFLRDILDIIAEQRANVISIQHHRIGMNVAPGQSEIELSLETRDQSHIEDIEKALKENGYHFAKKM
ncbi:threonine ammonia-lyase [Bacillus marinisedimentorum]|uniref:threonine ammonia-lyase n=1 Tax=Bacillus marinisedimentorum TaxID=1821260 RepID=UPI0007E14A08|nr:threonine ammonia-lyase [Bacillus marinisedimentorum]